MGADAGHPSIDLTGQVALVTGGGRGLGRAFALALARAGARVAVTARTAAPLAETVEMVERAGGRALAVPGDVSAPEAVAHVVRTAESQLGAVDILVNNAGAVGTLGYDWEVDPEEWWRTFEINVRGPFLYARAVLPRMVDRRRGRIVNVSTGAGFNRLPQMDAYCATKAALTQWTRCLAADIQADHLISASVPNAVQAFFHSALSQGRDTPIERSAQMLLFLVSGRADALSGRFIRAQDDEEELVRRAEEIRRDDLHVVTLRT
jgi:NAD(P)-dependent dehydrogenase (short-subunit alcohol dehydrogenase family)